MTFRRMAISNVGHLFKGLYVRILVLVFSLVFSLQDGWLGRLLPGRSWGLFPRQPTHLVHFHQLIRTSIKLLPLPDCGNQPPAFSRYVWNCVPALCAFSGFIFFSLGFLPSYLRSTIAQPQACLAPWTFRSNCHPHDLFSQDHTTVFPEQAILVPLPENCWFIVPVVFILLC